MSVEEYLSTLKDQIRDKNAKDMIAAEYLCHIEDQATAFQNAGMEREQALLKAVEGPHSSAAYGMEIFALYSFYQYDECCDTLSYKQRI